MATNDFLPFGGGAGANVLTQAAYVAQSALRSNGFSSGTAQSAQLNKVWRQSSIIAAVIGQVISDLTGQDALDDGTISTLVANLKNAIRAQSIGVVGTVRNLKASLAAAATSIGFVADEIVLESSFGGLAYRLANFSKSINLATTGAGGMDTGTAPANGFVGIYAIYNPTTGASALLGVNATSASVSEVYGGANMPAGYSASALISVWPTNASSQLMAASQSGRRVGFMFRNALTTSTPVASLTSLSLSSIVPRNASAIGGMMSIGSVGVSALNLFIASDAIGSGYQMASINASASGSNPSVRGNFNMSLMTAQTMFWGGNGGANAIAIDISSYEI
jgi:hypothetical protein